MLRKSLETGRREEDGGTWEFLPLSLLSRSKERSGDLPAAVEFARRRMEVAARHARAGHVSTAMAAVELARLTALSGDAPAAVVQVSRAMPVVERSTASNSGERWLADRDASSVMRRGGRPLEAERYARESLRIALQQSFTDSDPRLGNSWEVLGEALAVAKKSAAAIRCLGQAHAIYLRAGQVWSAAAARTEKRIEQSAIGDGND